MIGNNVELCKCALILLAMIGCTHVWAYSDTKPESAKVLTSSTSKTDKITSSSGGFNSGPVAAFANVSPSRMLKQAKSLNLMYTFATAQAVNGYGIKAGGSYFAADRGPKTWKFYGSNDYVPGNNGTTDNTAADAAATWVELDSQSDQTGWSSGEYRYYTFVNANSYTTYKIEISANNGNTYTQWLYLEYCYESSCSLGISGVPEQLGTVTPDFGSSDMPTTATTFTSYDVYTNDASTIALSCAGYKLYQKDPSEIWQVVSSGSERSFTLDPMPTVSSRVEWQYNVKYYVNVAANAYGSVAGGGWYERGTNVELVPTPTAGYRFAGWSGDIPDGHGSDNPLVFTADKPKNVMALFLPEQSESFIQYVSPNGDDGNDGFTWETAKKTPGTAISYMSLFNIPGTVLLTNGSYKITSTLTLTAPIAVRGVSSNPRDVIITKSDSAFRVFKLDNAQSYVANLTITNGYVQQDQGSNVRISTNGGTVSNCVITGGYAWNYYSGAAVLLESANALVTHCDICRSSINQDHEGKGVVAVDVVLGRLENSLIHHNYSSEAGYAIARAKGTGCSIVNCTIVNNYAKTAVGLYAGSGSVVQNNAVYYCRKDGATTAVADRVISPWGVDKAASSSSFANCAFDGESLPNDTCKLITAAAFKDYANGDYTPQTLGGLYNKGAALANPPATDLAGKPRVLGKAIDIGCYEGNLTGIVIMFK